MPTFILPGKELTSSILGWTSIGNLQEDLLDNITPTKPEFGIWGDPFYQTDIPDSQASHYAIPNPWATALLFKSVMRNNTHPLYTDLFHLTLNFFNDFFCYNNFTLETITEPNNTDTPFNIFWDMAPEFLKFSDDRLKKMYFFRNKITNKIIGGLSRGSLIWLSQGYDFNLSMEHLLENPLLIKFLSFLKKSTIVDNTSLNTSDKENYWNETWFKITESDPLEKTDYIIPTVQPVSWIIKRIPINPQNKKFYTGICFLFDKTSLDGFNDVTYEFHPDLHNKISDGHIVKFDTSEGVKDCHLFQDLFEPVCIKLKKKSKNNEIVTLLSNTYLWPIKPFYLQAGLDLKDLNIVINSEKSNKNIISMEFNQNITNKYILNHKEDLPCIEDDRSIAVWPPFPSKAVPIYVMEFIKIDKSSDIRYSDFYNHLGIKLEVADIQIKEKGDELFTRTYELVEGQDFPKYIRIYTKNDESGILVIEQSLHTPKADNLIIGIDFGTSHTTIAIKIDNDSPKIMTFNYSEPIVISSFEDISFLIDFIPLSLPESPPQTNSEFRSNKNTWIPFRTLWNEINENSNKFIKSGNIPLFFSPELELNNPNFVSGLKWTSDSRYRHSFLLHLLNMICVETEAIGYNTLEIRWAYPKIYTHTIKNSIVGFYTSFSDKYVKRNPQASFSLNGYSEATCSKEYFTRIQSQTVNPMLPLITMDMGGGTTDITFIDNNKVKWEDCIKFAGDDLSDNLLEVKNEMIKLIASDVDKEVKYDALVRCWPIAHKNWDGHLVNFMQKNKKNVLEKIALHYSIIFYYIGLQLNNHDSNPLNQLALAGNGINFFNFYTFGEEFNDNNIKPFSLLFSEIIKMAHGKTYLEDIELIFSNNPKKEVALGILYMNKHESPSEYKMADNISGIAFKNDDNYMDWNEKMEDIEKIGWGNGEIYFDNLNNFLNVYIKNTETIAELKQLGLGIIAKKAKEYLNSNAMKIRDHFGEEFTNKLKDSISIPLFFLIYKYIIEEIGSEV